MQRITRVTSFLAGTLLLACGDAGRRSPSGDTDPPGVAGDTAEASSAAGEVTAPLRNPAGKDVGTLTLSEADGSIGLEGSLSGLPPGVHGIHLHTTGSCDAPSFESAGDHWNPTSKAHGTQSPQGPHLGDFPNITVRAESSAMVLAITPGGALRGRDGLIDADGAAVVVHAKPDDYRTQPSGDSGDRIACGVVSGR